MTGRGQSALDSFSTDRSRPSKTNGTSAVRGPETDESTSGDRSPDDWWRQKNEIVDRFVEERPGRAARPISVRGGTKLRDEASMEKYTTEEGEERWRSHTWSTVLNEFLDCYNGYRDTELVFASPEGEEVRGDMENSHMPQYGKRYYAKTKAFERQVVKEYDDPQSVFITFSGSSENAHGGWRCPVDHLRDVIKTWRPDRGRGVYHVVRDILNGKDWEYVIVVEKHRSGYGHAHCGIFVDGEVKEEEFHPVIDTHLRQCEIAGRAAHDYHSPHPEDRPIVVNKIDPGNAEEGSIGNLGSYLAEYIGAYGEELFDRGLDELMFRAAAWATGSQIVRFSKEANELIKRDLEGDGVDVGDQEETEERVVPNPEYDPAKHAFPDSDVPPFIVENPSWSIVGIARGTGDDEEIFELRQSHVVWREIDDSSHLDPPKSVPSDRPRRRTTASDFSSY